MKRSYNTQRTAEGANSGSTPLSGQGHIYNSHFQPQINSFHTDDLMTKNSIWDKQVSFPVIYGGVKTRMSWKYGNGVYCP